MVPLQAAAAADVFPAISAGTAPAAEVAELAEEAEAAAPDASGETDLRTTSWKEGGLLSLQRSCFERPRAPRRGKEEGEGETDAFDGEEEEEEVEVAAGIRMISGAGLGEGETSGGEGAGAIVRPLLINAYSLGLGFELDQLFFLSNYF